MSAFMATLILTGLGYSDACLQFTPMEAAAVTLITMIERDTLEDELSTSAELSPGVQKSEDTVNLEREV